MENTKFVEKDERVQVDGVNAIVVNAVVEKGNEGRAKAERHRV